MLMRYFLLASRIRRRGRGDVSAVILSEAKDLVSSG
jgi:hypothetical protein